VLPLFFGALDACVVDEVNLELLKEMNPQLAKLRVLARSAPLLESVIATPVEPHPHRKELLETILALNNSPRGRQLLMVFRTGRLVHFKPGDLDTTRALWLEHGRLFGSAVRSTPAPTPIRSAGTMAPSPNRPPVLERE
jgi:phosphonate transport system substrate-binding protein